MMDKVQQAELERIRTWACCFEPERRFMAEVKNAQLETENETLKEIQRYAIELCHALPSGAYPDDDTGDKCELLSETIRSLSVLLEEK